MAWLAPAKTVSVLILLSAVLCGRAEEQWASLRSDATRASTPMPVGAACDSIADQPSCDAAGCSWCKSGAVPDSCKTIDEARALPAAVFDCDHLSLADADCDSIADQSSCDAAGCSWCKSGAVPNSCKTIDEARALPAAVFDCDHLSLAGADCDSIADQSSCDAGGCSWCKSGAVPDSCKTVDEARALPAAVFDCDHTARTRPVAAVQ
jgi:hypothetical protein